MDYGQIFRDSRDSAMKQAALEEHMRQTRAAALLNQLKFQALEKDHAWEQLYKEQQMKRYLANDASRQKGEEVRNAATVDRTQQAQSADQAANFEVNTFNPPAAVAVTPPGGDDAWTNRANALRSRYFAAHPDEHPGPPVAYTGGAGGLSHIRPLLVPQTDKQDEIGKRMESTKLRNDLDKLRSSLGEFAPVDQLENSSGIYLADPKTGFANPTGGGLAIKDASGKPTIIPFKLGSSGFSPNAKNPIQTPDQFMQAYRDLQTKGNRLKQIGGGPPTDSAMPSPATAPDASGAPSPQASPLDSIPVGKRVQQRGRTYIKGADGGMHEVLSASPVAAPTPTPDDTGEE